MREFTRIYGDFDPLPFFLVSDQDHVTPVDGMAITRYFISQDGAEFTEGTGFINEAGAGLYELTLGRDEQDPVPRLIFLPGLGYDPVYFRVNGPLAPEIAGAIDDSSYLILFAMVSADDHVTPTVGLTPTVTMSRDGGAFISVGSATAIGRGFYRIVAPTLAADPTRSDECIYVLRAVATGADPLVDFFQVFRYLTPA